MEHFCEQAKNIAGGPAALAAELTKVKRISPQAVSQWKIVPPDRALEVERVTGVSRHDLRPDVFGPAPKPRPSKAKQAEATQ